MRIMNHEELEMLIRTFYHAISCFSITIFIHALKHGAIYEQGAYVPGCTVLCFCYCIFLNESIYTVSVSHIVLVFQHVHHFPQIVLPGLESRLNRHHMAANMLQFNLSVNNCLFIHQTLNKNQDVLTKIPLHFQIASVEALSHFTLRIPQNPKFGLS